VFLIPAALFGLLGVHLYLVVKRGISEPPVAGERVDPRTYLARYRELLRGGIPFYPDAAVRDAVVSFVAVVVVIGLAVVAGAPLLGKPPDPTIIVADPHPDWYFLGYFALLAIIPKGLESIVIIGLPALAFGFLFLLPLIRPRGERHPSRRPMALAAVGLGVLVYGALTAAGFASSWVPVSTEGASLPPAVLSGLTAPEAAGAQLFVRKDCFACHQIGGAGGRRGPDLGSVGSRLSRDQIVTTILAGKGQSMPSFASAFTPQELADLVAYLETRR
jgi:ubiquinol-cytochrome c reductase cytochrome b subunit